MTLELSHRSEELRYKDGPTPDLINWSMNVIEVDGVVTKDLAEFSWSRIFLSYKDEEDYAGNPTDTGDQWRWQPDFKVSEKHWLKCRRVMAENSLCDWCGER